MQVDADVIEEGMVEALTAAGLSLNAMGHVRRACGKSLCAVPVNRNRNRS